MVLLRETRLSTANILTLLTHYTHLRALKVASYLPLLIASLWWRQLNSIQFD